MKTALWFLLFGVAFFVGGIVSHQPWPALFGVAGFIIGLALLGQARQHRQDEAALRHLQNMLDRM